MGQDDQPKPTPFEPPVPPAPIGPSTPPSPAVLPAPPSFEPEPRADAAPEAWDAPNAVPTPTGLSGDRPWAMVDSGPIEDGTWKSDGYASSNPRAWLLRIALVVEILICLGVIVLERGLELGVANGLRLTPQQGDVLTSSLAMVSGATIVVGLTVTLATFVWLSRAVDNVPPLTGRTPLRSPREAIGWWFVPVASWFMPYTIVRDLAWRLRTQASDGTPRLVAVWWCLHAGSLIANLLWAAGSRGFQADQQILLSQVLVLIAAVGDVLLLLAVASLARSERVQAERLGMPAGGPRQWPQFVAGWGPAEEGEEITADDGPADLAYAFADADPLAPQPGERTVDYEDRLLAELEGEATRS